MELPEHAARIILEGFDRHYRIFREASRAARGLFEAGDWSGLDRLVTERIDFYDQRVQECIDRLSAELDAARLDERIWAEVKREYILLLTSHKQPELAETFFNSISTRMLERIYYRNQFLFVRPTISTEHMDSDPPSYRCYYPLKDGIRRTLRRIIQDLGLSTPFADLTRDLHYLLRVVRTLVPRPITLEANHHVQVLGSLFIRGQAAYVVGRAINGDAEYPFVVPIRHDDAGRLYLDAVLLDPDHLAVLFSASRAYFMVEMDVPATYVEFLRRLLPSKPKWELYTILGLQKAGKNLFYRDLLHHLRHSSDEFVLAPGTRGLVMVVFTLPSYPYVFKVIRDRAEPPKEVTREGVRAKYWLVKHHDRAGRMADTLEYSDVVVPRGRLGAEVLNALKEQAPSMVEEEDHTVLIKHVYIERRMIPLDMFVDRADDEDLRDAIDDYGLALRELAATNIFPGDLLLKNFGVTRLGRVVFYDYDEIDYLTAMKFRDMPRARDDEDELRSEPWFSVGPKDVFPEELAPFLLGDPRVRAAFLEKHGELLTASYWREAQGAVREKTVEPPLGYPEAVRFSTLFRPGLRWSVRLPRRPKLFRLFVADRHRAPAD